MVPTGITNTFLTSERGKPLYCSKKWLVLKCLLPDGFHYNCIVGTVCLTAIEFQKIVLATAIGFFIMGFIGYFVKLIHIPINNIIVYVIYCVVMVTVIIFPAEDHEHWDNGLFSNFVYFNCNNS